VDIGAYTGEWAQDIIDKYNPTVYAFEPNPNIFKQLLQRAGDNPKLHPLEFGLGDQTASADISMKGLGSSIFAHQGRDDDANWKTVQIKAVDEVWKNMNFTDVDLVKINIEGAEFPLLEKMIESELLTSVRCFMIQFHEWHPKAYSRRKKIRQALSKTHRLDWDYHFIWEKWTRHDNVK
jgi:FkbM family methyltransferase